MTHAAAIFIIEGSPGPYAFQYITDICSHLDSNLGDVAVHPSGSCDPESIDAEYELQAPAIIFGEAAYEEYFGKPLPGKLHNLRGTSFWEGGRRYVLTYAPDDVVDHKQTDSRSIDFSWDLTLAISRPIWPEPQVDRKVIVVNDDESFDLLLDAVIEGNEEPWALDIETAGFSPFNDAILCIAIAITPDEAFVVAPEIWDPYSKHCGVFNRLLKSGRWLLHNGKFDARFIREQLGVTIDITEDSMLLHYILDERVGTHGLKQLVQQRLALPDYEKELHAHLKRKMDSYATIPKDVLYHYAGQDVCFTLELLTSLRQDLHSSPWCEGLTKAYRFLLEASNAFVEIESNGMHVDQTVLNDLEDEIGRQVESLDAELVDMTHDQYDFLDVATMQALRNDKKPPTTFNPRSFRHVQIMLYDILQLPEVQLFRARDNTARPTSREALDKFQQLIKDGPGSDFISLLIKYRETKKILSTYVLPIRAAIAPDGRLRTDLRLHGTVTGRLASSKPNMQNVPRPTKNESARMIRNLFTAESGNRIVGFDYSSAELRVMASFAKDEELKRVWENGEDLHSTTCMQLFGDVTPEKRMIAKMFNFGLAYGRGANSIAVERGLSKEEAHALMRRFFDAKPQLEVWLNETKQLAVQQGWLQTPVGRVRRFGLITEDNKWRVRTQSTNFPIQSTASDITLRAALDIHYWLRDTGLGKVLLLVHDSIYVECAQEHVKIVSKAMRKFMMAAAPVMLGGIDFVPFNVDGHDSHQWGDL